MNTQQQQPLEMTPRRKQFFRMVSEGLKVGFEGEDLSRIENFVRYCKGELDFKALGPLHKVWFSRELAGRNGKARGSDRSGMALQSQLLPVGW